MPFGLLFYKFIKNRYFIFTTYIQDLILGLPTYISSSGRYTLVLILYLYKEYIAKFRSKHQWPTSSCKSSITTVMLDCYKSKRSFIGLL
nr:MAG TPA: hypothetical protein [Caudoviricetes sp.]